MIDPNRRVRITPQGALAGAFARLVQDAEDPKAWWRTSPLLAGTGLAYHLDELGYEVVPKDDQTRQDNERPGTYVGSDGREYEHAD